jgi:hypothetical protein
MSRGFQLALLGASLLAGVGTAVGVFAREAPSSATRADARTRAEALVARMTAR